MRILDELIDSLPGKDTPVRQVCAGAFWTAVTTRSTGLASTYRELGHQHGDRPSTVKEAGELIGKRASELAGYARSDETVEASIGMATINSLLEVEESKCIERGAFDVLAERGRGRNIAVVGHFPFVSRLRELARNLWVIEKHLHPGDHPESDAPRILPQCEVVCLTGTTLINHTTEKLLSLCKGSFVVLTGPTSPLAPVLFEFGIDAICGTRVTDADEVIRFVSQGANFQQLRGHGVKLLTLAKQALTQMD
ncbi:MAG TPA: DUF364 domain-containing protein [Verrucomicrobiae bacterium]|nr:DUF364 domain-containing protein [Verrucomicrobiae bacterium]